MRKFVYVGCFNDYDLYFGRCYEAKTDNVFQNLPPDRKARKNGVVRFLYRLHNTPKIEKYLHLPFKGVWNRFYLDKHVRRQLHADDEICFIFSGENYQLKAVGFFDYLRKKYPKCRLMLSFGDKVALYEKQDKAFDIDALKISFDVVASYNKKDVDKYGLVQLPTTPHDFSLVEEDATLPASDVLFVGREKGRLGELIGIYEVCTAAGYTCDFHIVGVPEDKQKYPDSISYNKKISYRELLARTKRSRCVLNIVQDGVEGLTLRDYEAIGMNKLLMTNGSAIKELPTFRAEMMVDVEHLEKELYKLADGGCSSWGEQDPNAFSDYFQALGHIAFG